MNNTFLFLIELAKIVFAFFNVQYIGPTNPLLSISLSVISYLHSAYVINKLDKELAFAVAFVGVVAFAFADALVVAGALAGALAVASTNQTNKKRKK